MKVHGVKAHSLNGFSTKIKEPKQIYLVRLLM